MCISNKSGESGYFCLIFDFRGKAFSFSPLSMILAEGLSFGLYYVEILSFIPILMSVLIISGWFIMCFFCIS